ncbi:MAG: hypothetical protein H0X37_07320 [Herpetosiphonaceae bacterium]|nr:hypothetical protein [Herpetosiphonaceae bacterium]
MSDTYRRYHAIKRGLMQFYQPQLTGHRERHFNTLIAMICGLAGGHCAHLSTIADHAPSGAATQESLLIRLAQGAPPLAQARRTYAGHLVSAGRSGAAPEPCPPATALGD